MVSIRNTLIAAAVAGALSGSAFGATITLTPAVAADITQTQTACTALLGAKLALDLARVTNDTAGVTSALATVNTDSTALRTAQRQLETDIKTYLTPAGTAASAAAATFEAAFTTLRADVGKSASAATIATDKSAVTAAFNALVVAEAQLQASTDLLAGSGANDECIDARVDLVTYAHRHD